MTDLTDLARHWLNQTAKGKGLRLDSDQLDLLNSLGIGEIIAAEAAKTLRAQCRTRTLRSIPVASTVSNGTADGMEASVPLSSRSSGMTTPPDAIEAAARARARCAGQRRH
jgi:hypothetical protein